MNPIGYRLIHVGVHIGACIALFCLLARLRLGQETGPVQRAEQLSRLECPGRLDNSRVPVPSSRSSLLDARFSILGLQSSLVPLLATLLYAIGKHTKEPLRWLCGFHDLAASLFYVLAMLFLLRWREKGRWWDLLAMAAFVACAFLSKEDTISLPVVLALLWWWEPERGEDQGAAATVPTPHGPKLARRFALLCVLLVSLTTIYLALLSVHSERVAALTSGDGLAVQRTVKSAVQYLYFLKTLAEANLVPNSPGALLLLIALLVYLTATRRASPLVFCTLWVLCAAGPISVGLGPMAAAAVRYTRVPYLGLCAVVAVGLVELLSALRDRRLSFLGLLLMGAFVQFLVTGFDPLSVVPAARPAPWSPLLAAAVAFLIFAALRSRYPDAARWSPVLIVAFLFELLSFALVNTPWWVWGFGSWFATVAWVRLAFGPVSRREFAMVGVLTTLIFGMSGPLWEDMLIYSAALGLLGLVLDLEGCRRAVFAGLLVAAVLIPLGQRWRETPVWETHSRNHRRLLAEVRSKVPPLSDGEDVTWVQMPGAPTLFGGERGVLRCWCGFPRIRLTVVEKRPAHPGATVVEFYDWDRIAVTRAEHR